MSLSRAMSFWGRGLMLWLALCMAAGNDPGLPYGKESRDVKEDLPKAGEQAVDSDRPTECGLGKLTKRSSPSDASWFRDVGSREANCQIFSVTTALPRITPSRVSTKDPGKGTTWRAKAASPEEEPRLLYFMPYYPHRQHAFYNILFPVNRGASGYNTIWYHQSLGQDSSEEKRRKRETLPTSRKKNAAVSLQERPGN